MSQDSEEIKTIEQWKWSEMQGLELLPPTSSSSTTTTTTATDTTTQDHKFKREINWVEREKTTEKWKGLR